MAATGDAAGVLRLAGALAAFWHHRGYLREGRRWLEWALEHAVDADPLYWRGRALAGLSLIIWSQGDPDGAAPPAEAALAIAEAVGDPDLTRTRGAHARSGRGRPRPTGIARSA